MYSYVQEAQCRLGNVFVRLSFASGNRAPSSLTDIVVVPRAPICIAMMIVSGSNGT